jgi:hypothetical protein
LKEEAGAEEKLVQLKMSKAERQQQQQQEITPAGFGD